MSGYEFAKHGSLSGGLPPVKPVPARYPPSVPEDRPRATERSGMTEPQPQTLTLKVPTPESLGLWQVEKGRWSSTSKHECITILVKAEGARLSIDATFYSQMDGVNVQLPSLDHALVALGLILGKVA